jgi:hypothetical protein
VEEFDAATHERIRSIVDLDYDGTADLLVLFQDGRPVFSKRLTPKPSGNILADQPQLVAHQPQPVRRSGDVDRLAPLADPFRVDRSISGTNVAPSGRGSVGLSTSGGLPVSSSDAISPVRSSARFMSREVHASSLAYLSARSPRGPPLS